MIYYRRYIGAYQKRTTRLSMRDHGAYALMLDFYYAEELPLPLDVDEIYDICKVRTPDDRKAVDKVLRIHFQRGADGYHNERADKEIAASKQARENGKGHKSKRTGVVTEDPSEPATGGATEELTGDGTGEATEEGGGSGHPSTFNHSAVQPSNLQPSTDSPAQPPAPNRAGAIAVLIRNLEKERGKAPKVTSIDPRVVAWAEQGVTDDELREAHELAVTDRKVNGEDAAINAGFLDVFVAKVRTPGNGISRLNGTPADWWESVDGIKAKASELGISGNNADWLKCAIAAKLGGDTWPWIDARNITQQRLIEEYRVEIASATEGAD